MSMDLEFPKTIPKIHLPPIQIPLPNSPIHTPTSKHSKSSDSGGGCRTPTSEENKIPKILNCPGAPRKPRIRQTVSCKRKLTMGLQFFEIVNQEEVDSFFRSAFDLGLSGAPSSSVKRTCSRPSV